MAQQKRPTHITFDSAASTELEAAFARLAAEWKRDTAHLSSTDQIVEHPAYRAVIGMGTQAIPLILRDLGKSKAPWFWALRGIAGESPVRPEDRGDVDAMTAAWIEWGARRRYV